jgi:RND family efflux transporter MFP subunit
MDEDDKPRHRGRWLATTTVAGLAIAAAIAWWLNSRSTQENPAAARTPAPVPVVTATVERRDVPVRLRANGSAVALQSVDIRAQITSTVRTVHIREGGSVRAGELLFTLDNRAEEAALRKAQAQVEKDLADLEVASRNLERQKELFAQKFIAQAALDAAQNQVDALRGQLAVDRAAVEAARVSLAYTEIRASFAGRTGAIGVRPGSLVQPNGAVLVTVTQIDPMAVAFTLPEKELGGLQRAVAAGPVEVQARVDGLAEPIHGRLVFVDNAVDTATATIRVKAEFANADARLWPGLFVGVTLAPRVLAGAAVVPAQAVQTGPAGQFVFVVGGDRTVSVRPVTLDHVEGGLAAVSGVDIGASVVVEGAQNLRPGSVVTEAARPVPVGSDGEGGAGQQPVRSEGPRKAGRGRAT